MSENNSEKKNRISRRKILELLHSRILILGVIGIGMAVILIGRLFFLQVIQGSKYYEDYVQITKRDLSIEAPRGRILDCNGKVLAENQQKYSVAIRDTGEYNKRKGEFNEMILRLIHLLERFGTTIQTPLPITINEHDEFEFNGNENAIRRLITDAYGKEKIEKLQEDGEDPYSYSAEKVMERLKSVYYFSPTRWPAGEQLSKQDVLKLCNVLYLTSANTYTRYQSTVICSDISEDIKVAVLEDQSNLKGVEIKEELVRVYPNSEYFSHILGYIGKASDEELKTLRETDDSYVLGDVVGRTGIEQAYESALRGKKGNQSVYLNNVGEIMDTVSKEDPVNGNDVQLTIDADLQIAVYNMLEQRMAAVVAEKLIQGDFTPTTSTSADNFKIPVKNAYFQMFNNNILTIAHFAEADATEVEKNIYAKFSAKQQQIIAEITNQLITEPKAIVGQSDEMKEYLNYIYKMLSPSDKNKKILSGVDYKRDEYQNISVNEFLHKALTEGWLDPTKLESEEKYSNIDEWYGQVVDYIISRLPEDTGFSKLIYKYLIQDRVISGNEICLALFDQGILKQDAAAIERLKTGNETTAYEFFKEKIIKVEITPTQLALDPCAGSAVVVDKNTGELRALVSYPGYDLNRMSGSVDAAYYKRLLEDLSSPLYNRATQTRTAPGSTFKLITSTAALMEGIIDENSKIWCTGIFNKLNHPRCWIYRDQGLTHGALTVSGAIKHSCNIFFYECGYRLSTDANGAYKPSLGLEKLSKYASLYGFDSTTGLEIVENKSKISDDLPVPSAIGQGNHNFTAIAIARYVTSIATRGNVYEFHLMDKILDNDGNVVQDDAPQVIRHLDFPDTVWNTLHEGMYGVTHENGSAGYLFNDLYLDIAGKSGTAQENLLRGSHGLFVSFGPYENPEIVTTVSIQNAYTSGNAALVTKDIYRYQEGILTLDDIKTSAERALKEEKTQSLSD
ncbi:MAG: penicillin-binding protein [Clostridiales bacterium]|nr:penicillin-binding protein [Clostridiales bacterium]